MLAKPVEELAPWTEEQVQAHLAAGKLVEGAPAHVAEVPRGHAPDPHRLRRHRAGERALLPARRPARARRSTTSARRCRSSRTSSPTPTSATGCSAISAWTWTGSIYERPAEQFKYPYAFDVPLNSWVELVCANALYDQAGFVLLSRRLPDLDLRPLEARAGQGRQGGDLPPAPRPHLAAQARQGCRRARPRSSGAIDWMFILTLEWFGLPDELKKHSEQLDYGFKGKTNDELRQAWMAEVVPVHGRDRDRGPGPPRPATGTLRDRLPVPGPVRRGEARVAARRRARSAGTRC